MSFVSGSQNWIRGGLGDTILPRVNFFFATPHHPDDALAMARVWLRLLLPLQLAAGVAAAGPIKHVVVRHDARRRAPSACHRLLPPQPHLLFLCFHVLLVFNVNLRSWLPSPGLAMPVASW